MTQRPSEDDQPVDASPSVGLFEGFQGYKTPTEGHYEQVLTKGLVVVDANVLLDLYRYNADTRNDLFNVLQKLGDRLWIPHQVAAEFWKNREAALYDLKKKTEETVAALEGIMAQISDPISQWSNRISLEKNRADEITKIIVHGFEEAIKKIKDLGGASNVSGHWDTNRDEILATLAKILEGRVGAPLAENDLVIAKAEALRRVSEEIPPGYKDKKKGDDANGDYLVWHQTLLEAAKRHQDVLLVTSDVKEDWWRKPGGQTRGPRLELIDEMKSSADVRLFMMRTESLLLHARSALKVEIKDSSVEEVERVENVRTARARSELIQSLKKMQGLDSEHQEKLEQTISIRRKLTVKFSDLLKERGYEIVPMQLAIAQLDIFAMNDAQALGISIYPPYMDLTYEKLVSQAIGASFRKKNLGDKIQFPEEVELVCLFDGYPPLNVIQVMNSQPMAMAWLTKEGWVGNTRANQLSLTSA